MKKKKRKKKLDFHLRRLMVALSQRSERDLRELPVHLSDCPQFELHTMTKKLGVAPRGLKLALHQKSEKDLREWSVHLEATL